MERYKYIFIDFDGVLVLEKDRHTFSTEAIGVLKHICESTGARVVVCSSWREKSLAKTVRHLPADLRKLIVSQTPDLSGRRLKNSHFKDRLRYLEIMEWLRRHDCDSYIVIDDEQEHYTDTAMLWCCLLKTDPAKGLTKELGACAVMMLEHPWKVTDCDAGQRCRVLRNASGEEVYEYEQNGPDGEIVNDTIDLGDYTLDKEFENKYLAAYGYTLESIKEIYGEDWRQIVAECIFETDND